jgi:hypothetical protein
MRVFSIGPSVLLLCTVLTVNCGGDFDSESPKVESWHPDVPSQSSTLKIQYFWSTSGDENQYSSTRTGIEAAETSKEFQELRDSVVLVPRKDPDSQQEAMELASELRRKPDTLAVIGHTRSGTTLATLPIYAEAGIPVLIPTATSPYLLYRHNTNEMPAIDVTKLDQHLPRFDNAFRLPPSDVPDQVHAIELAIKNLKGQVKLHDGLRAKVMLVCDTTAHYRADVYTKPMCDRLTADANDANDYKIASLRHIDLDSGDIWGLVTELHAVDPDFVVLVGYQELARDILQEIAERATTSGKQISRYTFIMTEDCLHNELLKFFLNTKNFYVTSPVIPQVSEAPAKSGGQGGQTRQEPVTSSAVPNKCDDRENGIKKLREQQQVQHIVDTDEGFAYDSVLILASAIKRCKEDHSLNRPCVLSYLRENQQAFQGACETYHLDGGERANAFYYVYSINARGSNRKFQAQWSARKEDVKLNPVAN